MKRLLLSILAVLALTSPAFALTQAGVLAVSANIVSTGAPPAAPATCNVNDIDPITLGNLNPGAAISASTVSFGEIQLNCNNPVTVTNIAFSDGKTPTHAGNFVLSNGTSTLEYLACSGSSTVSVTGANAACTTSTTNTNQLTNGTPITNGGALPSGTGSITTSNATITTLEVEAGLYAAIPATQVTGPYQRFDHDDMDVLARLLCVTAFALFAVALAGGPSRAAGGFDVGPLLVVMTNRQPSGAVTVKNNDDTSVIFQVHTYRWSDADGREVLSENDGLLVVPPVFEIAPGEQRVIRIALRHPVSDDREQAYRVVVTQVPSKVSTGGAVQFVSEMRIPVFVRPDEKTSAASITWTANRTGTTLALTATNTGDVHAKLLSVRVYGDIGRKMELGETTVASYLLPGETRRYTIPLVHAPPAPAIVVEAQPEGDRATDTTLAL